VERLWNTCQDRLVKELRLAKACTMQEANELLDKKFGGWFNRHCTNKATSPNDAHRPIDKLDLDAILSIQHERVVMNDYTIRYQNQVYQLLPPALPGQRGGKVVVENRADGSMKIRFKGKYLSFEKFEKADKEADGLGALPPIPRSLAHQLIPVVAASDPAEGSAGSITVHQTDGRSGRTPALPCPPERQLHGNNRAMHLANFSKYSVPRIEPLCR
jgi:hypothetical protein